MCYIGEFGKHWPETLIYTWSVSANVKISACFIHTLKLEFENLLEFLDLWHTPLKNQDWSGFFIHCPHLNYCRPSTLLLLSTQIFLYHDFIFTFVICYNHIKSHA
jgi:hypothetical protein